MFANLLAGWMADALGGNSVSVRKIRALRDSTTQPLHGRHLSGRAATVPRPTDITARHHGIERERIVWPAAYLIFFPGELVPF